jgi:hypothetical protein
MFKERIFRKKVTVSNFKIATAAHLEQPNKKIRGKNYKTEAEIVAQVFYTPRGFCCEVELFSPLDTWDTEQYCRIEGINEESPEGDLLDKNFDTILAAQHFVTRRLKRLGWEPLGDWSQG